MNLHRALVIALLALVTVGAFLVILWIWGFGFDPTLLFRLLATVGVLIVLAGLFLVIKADFSEHKRLKDQNFID